ncbi:ankyrin repeat domain-containing protein, chloroplastic [Phoenix dactylifera]|uniref:Ankyrin repeat domain-containing protein, chloroplastic n=1 Tax=Phoenix dactylifera TaxID=42345 RepID=A0A8B8ZTJ9_PHODC|nr:ankyrin repeat domain-containing protein, chloroplastic [Phoenix dactylifera]
MKVSGGDGFLAMEGAEDHMVLMRHSRRVVFISPGRQDMTADPIAYGYEFYYPQPQPDKYEYGASDFASAIFGWAPTQSEDTSQSQSGVSLHFVLCLDKCFLSFLAFFWEILLKTTYFLFQSKWLPIHTLAASGEFYLLDALLKQNVDINAIDKDGLSAIHRAILCKKQAIFDYLLRNSANPFVRDRDGATLIHYAVQTAASQTIKILLLYNVDINFSDNDGWTPLHLAVQTRRTDIVRLLLIKGADKTLKNRDGLTPLDLCLYSGRDLRTYELIKLLKGLPLSKSRS